MIRFDLVTDKRRVDKSPERDSRLAGFTSELGRLAKSARTSAGFSRKQLSLRGLAPSLIQRIESGDPHVTVGELWTYATKLGVRATHLVPAEHMPFEDLDERATARSARLQFLRRLRRRKLPTPRSMKELIRVRSASPLATESELIEKHPVLEVAWPEAVIAAERRIDASLASKLLEETAALASTLEAFLLADLELARDIGNFANPGSAWLHHPHHDHNLSQALQQLAGHVQAYVAAAGALIDHSRRFRRRYIPAGTVNGTEYDQRLAATFAGPESTIVGCLRNYALHHSLPLVVGEPQEATAAGWSTLILLDTVSLLDGNFSAQEKALLSKSSRGVPMDPLVGMYSARVVSFYRWLTSRIPAWYRNADEELRALNRELQRALNEAGLGDLPRLFNQLERSKRGDIRPKASTRPPAGKRAMRVRRPER